MQVFITTPSRRNISYTTKSVNDTIIMLKRYIADKLEFVDRWKIYYMTLTYAGKHLNDTDRIIDRLVNESTVHVMYKCGSGPMCLHNETSSVYVNNEPIEVTYSPNDRVEFILQQVLETLVHNEKLDSNSLYSDFHLTLDGKPLNNNSLMAEYKELSPSFVTYNMQDDVINKLSNIGSLITAHGDYYQMILLGKREYSNKKLEFQFTKVNQEYEPYDCINCKCNNYSAIMPCCRKKLCNSCINKKCVVCKKYLIDIV